MVTQIKKGLRYWQRHHWDPGNMPRLGIVVNREHRRAVIVHHTVGADNDSTPNRWETLDECFDFMARLRTAHDPSLGNDVPYNDVVFPMMDGTMNVIEGRGHDRSGAHTAGRDQNDVKRNVSGIAPAWAGNHHDFTSNSQLYVGKFNAYLGWMKRDRGMIHLGDDHPDGLVAYGHRLVPGNSTACPGDGLVATLPRFRFAKGVTPVVDPITRREFEDLEADLDELSSALAGTNTILGAVGKLARFTDERVDFLAAIAARTAHFHDADGLQPGVVEALSAEVQAQIDELAARHGELRRRVEAGARKMLE